jgi:hypothetical protein
MKYFEDDVYSNKYMAKVGGISTREVFFDNHPFLQILFLLSEIASALRPRTTSLGDVEVFAHGYSY